MVCRGQVGFRDQVVPIKCDVAEWCEVEEFEVARAFGIDRGLQTAQLVVLHFQFDLVDEEFVHGVVRRRSGAGWCGHSGHGRLGLAAQGRGLVFRRRAHAVSFRGCSVVAMA